MARREAPGRTVRLNERLTVTARSGRTLAIRNMGPIEKSGCGLEARKIWAEAADGSRLATKAMTKARWARRFMSWQGERA